MKLIAILLLAFSIPAFAHGNPPPVNPPHHNSYSGVNDGDTTAIATAIIDTGCMAWAKTVWPDYPNATVLGCGIGTFSANSLLDKHNDGAALVGIGASVGFHYVWHGDFLK